MQDEIFGNLEYDYGWIGEYSYRIFGAVVSVKLVIPCDEGQEIERAQKDAFTRFDANKDDLIVSAERVIFDYYLDIVEEYREKLGPEFADKMAPNIDNLDQLVPLIKATEVIIQQSLSSEDRIVGLLFTCSWEPELGLAVKFVNELIEEVGTQDIVL